MCEWRRQAAARRGSARRGSARVHLLLAQRQCSRLLRVYVACAPAAHAQPSERAVKQSFSVTCREWTCQSYNKRKNKRTHARTNERLNQRTNKRTNEQTNERTEKVRVSLFLKVSNYWITPIFKRSYKPKFVIYFKCYFGIFIKFYLFYKQGYIFFVFTGLQTGLYFFFLRKEEKNYSPVCQMEFYVIVLWYLRWVESSLTGLNCFRKVKCKNAIRTPLHFLNSASKSLKSKR